MRGLGMTGEKKSNMRGAKKIKGNKKKNVLAGNNQMASVNTQQNTDFESALVVTLFGVGYASLVRSVQEGVDFSKLLFVYPWQLAVFLVFVVGGPFLTILFHIYGLRKGIVTPIFARNWVWPVSIISVMIKIAVLDGAPFVFFMVSMWWAQFYTSSDVYKSVYSYTRADLYLVVWFLAFVFYWVVIENMLWRKKGKVKLRFDQMALLVLAPAVVVGIVADSWLRVKLSIEPSLYASIILLFGSVFYTSHYIASRLTKKAVKLRGPQIESNPAIRHQYQIGSFRQYHLILTSTIVFFIFCIYLGLIGYTLVTLLLFWGPLACLSLLDAVGDYQVLRHLGEKKRRPTRRK
jgi:hypothetical protein